jgi:hypothetical protein
MDKCDSEGKDLAELPQPIAWAMTSGGVTNALEIPAEKKIMPTGRSCRGAGRGPASR